MMSSTIILIVIALYFLPMFVANIRRHKNRMPIAVTNLLLGWTFIGWVGALIWACTHQGEKANG